MITMYLVTKHTLDGNHETITPFGIYSTMELAQAAENVVDRVAFQYGVITPVLLDYIPSTTEA